MIRQPLIERQPDNNGGSVVHNKNGFNRLNDENEKQQDFSQPNTSQSLDTPIKQLNTSKQSSTRNINITNSSINNQYNDMIPSILHAATEKRKQLVINVPIQDDDKNKQNISPYRRNRINEKDLSKIQLQDQQQCYNKNYEDNTKQSQQQLIHEPDQLHDDQQRISSNNNDNDMLLFGHGLQTISQHSQHNYSIHPFQQSQSKDQIQHPLTTNYHANSNGNDTKQLSPAKIQLLQPPSLSQQNPNNKLQHQKNNKDKLSYSISQSIMPSTRFQAYINTARTPSMIVKFLNPSLTPKPKLLFSHNQSLCQTENYPRCQLRASRDSIIQKKQLQLTLANNLDKILFKYNGGHVRVLYNNKLKIKNNSPVGVEVKIMCTSPSHYDVKPLSNIVMCPYEIMSFVIEMKLYVYDLDHVTMKHDLQRYKGDMFKICYWPSQYSSDIQYTQGEKILPVVIEDTQQQKIRNEGLLKDQANEQLKMAQGERSIQMYKKMIGRNCEQMLKMELQIKQVTKNKFYTEYLTKNLFYGMAVIGLVMGWWLG